MVRTRFQRWCLTFLGILASFFLALVFARSAGAGDGVDWPTHRGDIGRRGFGGTTLDFPLDPVWHQSAAAPSPAWGPPARRSYWQRLEHLEPRVADDHCYPVVMAGGAVFHGSSTEDWVRCLDAGTGSVRWTFRVDGPVRYAPVVEAGVVYFGSDDGWIYAVAAGDGRLHWKHRAGPKDWRIPGNGRVISSWPVRSGLLVDQGTVFATAGLYPQQGVSLSALEARTGKVQWQTPLEESPEGYLLATDRLIVVPTGRASPVGFNRSTGRKERQFETGGGTYAVVGDGELFGGPGNDGTLTGVGTTNGERLLTVRGRNLVAEGGRIYLLENGTLTAVDRVRQAALGRQVKEIQVRLRQLQDRRRGTGSGADAGGTPPAAPDPSEIVRLRASLDQVRESMASCELWRVPCPMESSLIGTRNALVAGGSNVVAAFDRATGRRLWQGEVEGGALSLAAADGRLVVSTDRGAISVFAKGDQTDPVVSRPSTRTGSNPASGVSGVPDEPTAADVRAGWKALVKAGLGSRGYAVVAGIGSGRWIRELVRSTDLLVLVLDPDAERVAEIRSAAEAGGYYGTRLTAHVLPAGRLPFTDYFANLVISEAVLEGTGTRFWSEAELERLVRPFGGIRWTEATPEPVVRGELGGAGEWVHQYGNPANTASSGDLRLKSDLGLQWFGGPGPDVMVDRHLRGPAPMAAGGRLYVPGENRLLAVDAYNGTGLWQLELPGSQRYSMPYDAGYQSVAGDRIGVAVRDTCWLLDSRDGTIRRKIPLPPGATAAAETARRWDWGWLALIEGGLYGTAQWSTASRTVPGYEQIDTDYNNDQPMVTGRRVFRMDPEGGGTVWTSERGTLINPTVTWHRGRVVFVEARAAGLVRHATGRITLESLMNGEPWLVALDAATGRVAWEQRLTSEITQSRSILYLAAAGDRLVLMGSRAGDGADSSYLVECRSAGDGRIIWSGSHPAGKPGEFTHGEQVHHPVILGDWLVAEPVVYDLKSGRRLPAAAGSADWRLIRPGHSCGTLTGAGDCLFFRAGNPTVLDLRANLRGTEPARKLAPSRTGCWINMIPAGGLLLVPEASAGCVCQYSLQTSMAFLPR